MTGLFLFSTVYWLQKQIKIVIPAACIVSERLLIENRGDNFRQAAWTIDVL
jgi:hypothetical protein